MATKRYAAFLRGVSPMNAKMADLKKCFESMGFTNVKTVLSSGNVVFDAPSAATGTLERKIEKGMPKSLDRSFVTIVRATSDLNALLEKDPYRAFRVPANAKRVVTFLRTKSKATLDLPVEVHGAKILKVDGAEVFTTYVPSPRGAVFMTLIEKTFGQEVTTRTWDTVKKVARA